MRLKILVTRAAAAAVALLIALAASGCGVMSGETLENPKLAVNEFIDCMRSEDYDEAMKYVLNYSTLGFENVDIEAGSLDETLYKMLRESYGTRYADPQLDPISIPYSGVDMTVDGRQAFLTVYFTSLNFEMMSEVLKEEITETANERMQQAQYYDTEEKAMELIIEMMPLTFGEDLSAYYVERELTLEVFYTKDGWKLNISDELYNALLGR